MVNNFILWYLYKYFFRQYKFIYNWLVNIIIMIDEFTFFIFNFLSNF